MTSQLSHATSVVAQAANLFMTMQVSISTWKATSKHDKALAVAASAAQVKGDYGRLYVDMLGPYQAKLKEVVAEYTKIRTYVYENTEATSPKGGDVQAKGDRLVPTALVPKIIADLKELIADADDALGNFLDSYDSMIESVRAEHELGDWGNIDFPSRDEVRAKFNATISPPMPLQVVDAKNIPLSAELADKIAAASINAMYAKLNNAKDASFEAAGKRMASIAKSLTDGRVTEAALREAKHHGEFITEMGHALGDPRIAGIGKEIASKVVNVNNVEQWRNNPSKKVAAAKAATKAAKDIKKMTGVKAAPSKSTPDNATGVLVDLW
jgi:hypothetical protein